MESGCYHFFSLIFAIFSQLDVDVAKTATPVKLDPGQHSAKFSYAYLDDITGLVIWDFFIDCTAKFDIKLQRKINGNWTTVAQNAVTIEPNASGFYIWFQKEYNRGLKKGVPYRVFLTNKSTVMRGDHHLAFFCLWLASYSLKAL